MTTPSEVPDFAARQAMWSAIDFPPIDEAFPAIERYVRELRPLYANGKVEHRAFRLASHPVLDWFLTRNQYHEAGFFERFWSLPGPRGAFPHPIHDLNPYDRNIFSFCSPFLLGGSLAWGLAAGGAYHRFPRGDLEAKRLGEEAALEMLGGTYEHSLAYECGIAWSDFFFDVAWDRTFIAINPKGQTVHVLLATDTD